MSITPLGAIPTDLAGGFPTCSQIKGIVDSLIDERQQTSFDEDGLGVSTSRTEVSSDSTFTSHTGIVSSSTDIQSNSRGQFATYTLSGYQFDVVNNESQASLIAESLTASDTYTRTDVVAESSYDQTGQPTSHYLTLKTPHLPTGSVPRFRR